MINTIIIPLIVFALFLGAHIEEDAHADSKESVTAYSHIQQPCEGCKEWNKH